MPKKIALATCREYPNLTVNEKILAESLRELEIESEPLVWDNPSQSLQNFDCIIIRTCWDYHKRINKFLDWIKSVENYGVKLFNPPEIIRWNIEKTYLHEFENKGIKIPPTFWLEKGESAELSEVLRENLWQKAVLKPTISATAWRTYIVTPENAKGFQREFESLLSQGGVMIQKFVEEIIVKGEWSLMFFDKKFSHAVLKCAKQGDFRVQSNFGGTTETKIAPSSKVINTAKEIVESVSSDLLYARVDVVEINGEVNLMELELIEPVLFLKENMFAAKKFAEAIAGRITENEKIQRKKHRV